MDELTLDKELHQGTEEGFRRFALLWKARYFEDHFSNVAFRKYGYQKRNSDYEKRKSYIKRIRQPLIYSGALKEACKSLTVRVSQSELKITYSGAKWLKGYLSMRGRYGTGPDKVAELSAVADEEYAECESMIKDAVAEKINNR